ncbi:MAG TPA: AMP-binding protein, partial [Acidimicrobiales bacterium]
MYPGAHAATRPDHPAVIMAGSGQTMTYAELDDEANRLSQLFRSLGLQPGDHVAFCMENHPRFLAVAWGCHYAGLYYTAMSSRLTDDEMQYIINDCGARAFITTAYKREAAGKLLGQAPNVETWLMIDGTVDGFESYEDTIAAQPAEPLEGRIAGADMLYSSGTTGKPKGVKPPMPSQPLDDAGTSVYGLMALLFGLTEDSVYLSPAPLYHAAPLRFCMGAQMGGATVIVMERFDPEEALALIEQHRATLSQWVPTMFIRMLKLPDEVRARYDVSSMQAAVHAAAPCPVEVKRRMIEWWGPVLHEYYAGTEGNGFVYTNSEDWLAHPGSVGKALIGTLHIVDEESGEEVPLGEAGTVYFEGENAATFQYHNDPEKTEKSRDPKGRGWSTLGDV